MQPPLFFGQPHSGLAVASQCYAFATVFAAVSIRVATARGCDTKTAWLPFCSTTVERARLAMVRCVTATLPEIMLALAAPAALTVLLAPVTLWLYRRQ